jgi:2-polyprenyl-6-methoxyphenol hydroxylase-like FAD-dependent oxidoreductase
MDCIVIGAGVAGIAAAQGLRRIGARVALLERDRAPRETGYQLGIFGNGRYALDRLGLLDVLDAEGQGSPVDAAITIDGTTGRVVQRLQQHPARGRYRGHTYYRSDLHRALLMGLEGEAPRYGVEVASLDETGDGPVRLQCEAGETLEADLVVVADGARSRLREALFGPSHAYEPRCVGVIAAAEIDLEGPGPGERLFRDQARRHEFVQVAMPGRGAVLSLAARGRLGMVLATRTSDLPATPSGRELQAFARKLAEGMRDPRVHHAIDVACCYDADPVRAPRLWQIGDIEPLPAYARGRVALLGDAAHAMAPPLGQGANQSFEDAMRFAQRLRPAIGLRGAALRDELRSALQRWSTERRTHVTPIQRLSRTVLDAQFAEGRLRYRLTCAMLRFLPRRITNRQINYVLRHAIADPDCPIEALDERWIRLGRLRSR